MVFFVFFGTVRHFCLFLLKKIGFFWDSTAFLRPRPRKCCTVPKKPIFLRQKVQKCCTVPKKTKKTKVWRPWAPPGPGGLQLWFFLGQYGIFACFCLKDWTFWDSTAFLQSQASKVLYCLKKTNLFEAKSAKMLYCPKKTKKTKKTKVWRPGAPPGPGGLLTLVFLVFLGQYGIFACFC